MGDQLSLVTYGDTALGEAGGIFFLHLGNSFLWLYSQTIPLNGQPYILKLLTVLLKISFP